jgi:beta-galactosidase
VLVEAFDAKGTPCPVADNLVRFEVEGPAEIAGVGNGDELSLDPFQSGSRKLFFGKAMLILRSVEAKAGDVRITARSEGLKPGTATVHSRGR